jgi:endoglucanase
MKTAKRIAIAGYAIVLLLSVSGCGAPAPTATSIPPAGTSIPTPTKTVKPTATSTATITRTPTVGPGGFPRKFHVEGNAFVDQFGQKMIFRGMQMAPPILMALAPELGRWNWDEHYFEVMASWGAKIVRVPIDLWDLHKYGWAAVWSALDQTIAWIGENKMYVVIDFHTCGSIAENWYPPEYTDHMKTNMREFLGFWDMISKRYADNDIVAFYELFNEPKNTIDPPTKAMWMGWKEVAEQAISVIRANDPDKIILVGGLRWAYDLSYAADAPITGDNIGYVTHPYPQNIADTGKNWDTAFGRLSEEYPVFATEFAYDDFLPGFENRMIGKQRYSQAIIDYLEEHQISWMVFNFDYILRISLISDRDFTPTPQGDYFRSRLLYELEGSPKPRPGNFIKKTPEKGAKDERSNPTLTWSYSAQADSYEYCTDTSNNNACDASWISVGEQTNTSLEGLVVGTMYYWQVRASNADGNTYADNGAWGSFIVSTGPNLALHRPVKASSYENLTAMPENALDGDYLTRWGSKFSDPQWIQADLGAVFDINRIVLYWEAAFATSYEIQVSDNGSSWTTIYSTTTGNGGTDELSVSGSGRYVRMYGKVRNIFSNGHSYGYSLWEFEVYGS